MVGDPGVGNVPWRSPWPPPPQPAGPSVIVIMQGARPVGARFFWKEIIPLVKSSLRNSGLPHELEFVPPHLRVFDGLYADPDLWPLLFAMQHG